MGQEITTESDLPSSSGGLKKGLKSLSSCDAAARLPGHPVDQADEDKPNLFQRTMSGTGTFLKKTKNDVVCSARDLPKAATAIKTDGLNGRTAGRVALDVVGTTEVMPHQLIWNAAGSVVKSRTGIDLTPGGLKTKVAMAVIGTALERGSPGSVGVGLETAGRPNLGGERALSAIELLRGRGSAIQVAANLGRVSGVTEVVSTSSITNSVSIAARLGGGRLGAPFAGPINGPINGAIGAPIGETLGVRVAGSGTIFGAEAVAPMQLGIRVGPVAIEANRDPRYMGSPYSEQLYAAGSYPATPYPPTPYPPTPYPPTPYRAAPYSVASIDQSVRPLQIEPVSQIRTVSQIAPAGAVAPRPLYQASADLSGKSGPGQVNPIPDQSKASRSAESNSELQTPAQRAIEAMRLAHLQEATARATGQPVTLDPQTEAVSKRLDQEFADAELKAKAAILAADEVRQRS